MGAAIAAMRLDADHRRASGLMVWPTEPLMASKKLGQPEPDSYLVSAVNSSAPQAAQ